jgi:hypothetical protein
MPVNRQVSQIGEETHRWTAKRVEFSHGQKSNTQNENQGGAMDDATLRSTLIG